MTEEQNQAWKRQRSLELIGEPPKKKRKPGPGRPRIINNGEQVKWILGHIAGGYRFREIPAVGCNRWTWWRTVRRYPEVRELQKSARERRRKHWREYGRLRRHRQQKCPFCTPVYAGETGRFEPKKFRDGYLELVQRSIRRTALVLGVSRSTVWTWTRRIPEFGERQKQEQIRAFRDRMRAQLIMDKKYLDGALERIERLATRKGRA